MDEVLKITETMRPLRFDGRPRNPALLMREQMQRHHREMEELLCDLACEHFELQHVLREAGDHEDCPTANEWKGVEIIADRMSEILQERGVSTVDPTGEAWSNAMLDEYEVRNVQHREDIPTSRVGFLHSPLVVREGRVLRKGAVSVEAPAGRTSVRDSESDSGKEQQNG
jgi:molecular chaperone GrpE (heat shock protein)